MGPRARRTAEALTPWCLWLPIVEVDVGIAAGRQHAPSPPCLTCPTGVPLSENILIPAKLTARHVFGSRATSVEDQAAADERIPHLLRTLAAVRFLSCEPLLGSIDLSAWLPCYCDEYTSDRCGVDPDPDAGCG